MACTKPFLSPFPLRRAYDSEDSDEEKAESPCALQHKLIDFKLLTRIRQYGLYDIYYTKRLGPVSENLCWNSKDLKWGKCTGVVRFKVSRPVNIESYGFFGPFEAGSHGKYHMDISLLTENFCEISETSQVTPVIRHPDIFHVKFDTPVPILPCIWYIAKFSLLGPPTCQSQKLLSFTTIQCGEFGDVRFSFEMPDSNQLPEIGFSLRV